MTEETPAEQPEQEIEFHGRKVWVRMPRPEQILVWKRTLTKLQTADTGDWNGEQVLASLERLRKIIDSVLVNQTDIDWLDDEMLAGTIEMRETAAIVTRAIEAFAAGANRETRRAAAKAAPAKKAARKAPARTAGQQ